MPIYKTKRNDDLRTIASIFKLPSWKYLYQINRRIIGDNPDLLPEGIDLEIPEWDSTSGDEKFVKKESVLFSIPVDYDMHTRGIQSASL